MKRNSFFVHVLGFGFRQQCHARFECPANRLAAPGAESFPDAAHRQRQSAVGLKSEMIERQIAQFLGLLEASGRFAHASVTNARGREVIRRWRVSLRDGETRGRFIVRMHTGRSVCSEHRVAIRFTVIASRVVVSRNVGHCGRRPQLESASDAVVEIGSGAIRYRSASRVSEYGVSEVELVTIVTFGAHEDRGRHAFVERTDDIVRLARAGSNEQVGVERSAEYRRVGEDGRGPRRESIDPPADQLRTRWWQSKLIERTPFPPRSRVPHAAIVDQRA